MEELESITRAAISMTDPGADIYFTEQQRKRRVIVSPTPGFKACDRFALMTIVQEYEAASTLTRLATAT